MIEEIVKTEIETVSISSKIFEIRGMQVMLASDVALLYEYETKRINEVVSRNKNRFPDSFCFELTDIEMIFLRSQNATANNNKNRYNPIVFTEHGIMMLAGMLKSDIAVSISKAIITAFVEMRRFIATNANMFDRISTVEYKLLEQDKKIDEVFNLLSKKEIETEKIFYAGQIYDAYSFIIDLFMRAEKEIVVIDNYADKTLLDMLKNKYERVAVNIVTNNRLINELDISKYNLQYKGLTVTKSSKFHDRFIIIDDQLYNFGASLKDAGSKCFAVNKMEGKEFLINIRKMIY